ncbi:hypothetical protein [Halomonas stenophila]|uniref:Uncharacterized protein n=1 Tax=Halomonas stenophila TaxID=795312 RepID=A0A7W5HKJ7_9GAMM|nr:hypothetical protein [Halomonas stenophila]MBB3231925.1 hypothetical protein [Halomonas stenophila]
MQVQPLSPVPEGVRISQNEHGGYAVESVTMVRSNVTPSTQALKFCFSQNVPNINGTPVMNPSNTRITAQGREQVSFVVPMTMGTPLNYDMRFSFTVSKDDNSLEYYYNSIKIKGTWSDNEAPLPASQDAHLYVESSLEELEKITNNVHNCLIEES